jgi:hypothetical protein
LIFEIVGFLAGLVKEVGGDLPLGEGEFLRLLFLVNIFENSAPTGIADY